MKSTMVAAYQPGDRVVINGDVVTPLPLPGTFGIVREIIPCYGDNTVGYNVNIEGDARLNRVWFFLQSQLQPAAAQMQTVKEPS